MEAIEKVFSGPLRRAEGPGGWTIVVMPDSSTYFGTRRPVKVEGEMDGHSFAATLLPMGDGTHMVPVKASLRAAVGKEDGDLVTVRLTGRVT